MLQSPDSASTGDSHPGSPTNQHMTSQSSLLAHETAGADGSASPLSVPAHSDNGSIISAGTAVKQPASLADNQSHRKRLLMHLVHRRHRRHPSLGGQRQQQEGGEEEWQSAAYDEQQGEQGQQAQQGPGAGLPWVELPEGLPQLADGLKLVVERQMPCSARELAEVSL